MAKYPQLKIVLLLNVFVVQILIPDDKKLTTPIKYVPSLGVIIEFPLLCISLSIVFE